MKFPNANVFTAWFFMVQTLFMGWIAAAGGMLLNVLGVATTQGDIPSRVVGALLLFGGVFLVWFMLRGLPPHGKQGGKGYTLGHRLTLVGNVLAACLFVFHFFALQISDYNTHLVLDKFTTMFGYLCMGFFAVGFSFIYQSSLPQEKNS